MNAPFQVRQATPADRPAVIDLMRASGLAIQGLRADLLGFHLAESADGVLQGVACLEYYGPEGLLRSVATLPEARGQGIGRALVGAVEATATAEGLQRLFLLTMDAAEYFARLGYRPVPRNSAGVHMQASVQFSQMCPSSAVTMMRDVSAESP